MLLGVSIETKDLILRPLDEGYARGPYLAWMSDPTVTQYLEVRFAVPNEAALEAYIAKMNASEDCLLLGLFPQKEPSRHIGNIKLGPIDLRHLTAPVGILIGDKDMWGRGLATQAISRVADYAFAALGIERLEAGFYADNVPSQRAFRSAGFIEEGRHKCARRYNGTRVDEIVMGRLRSPELL